MKRLIRILTALMILVAIPIVIFAFFPRIAQWAEQQSWNQSLYLFLVASGALALFVGLDLLNRVEVYKSYLHSDDKDQFWSKEFQKNRLGFLKYGIGAVLLMCVILVFLVFNLMVMPKAPEGDWYLWSIKVLGMSIGVGVLMLLNAVLMLDSGKMVILGVEESAAVRSEKKVMTWQDKLFQLRPTFMDAEVDLKEDFDGITELDNPPPPWFMWLFYGTVIFGAIYFVRYTVLNSAPRQVQEYNLAMATFENGKKSFAGKEANNIDENTVTLETDKANLAVGETIFKTKCSTCHGIDGGGLQGSGPNLTDDYWIHGNSIKEIYKTIKYGVLSAGMVPWEGQLSPQKMKSVGSYVLSLRGSKPANPQPPKGDKMDPKEKF